MSDFIQQKPLILASGSISRQKLLKDAGLNFVIHVSEVNEEQIKNQFQGDDYGDLALSLAREKALTVSRLFPDTAVIAADQLCVCNDAIFDKPLTHERAREQLKTLQGKTHNLLTAVCIAQQNTIVWEHLESVKLVMRNLSSHTIEKYLQLAEPYNSCGSYHFEEKGPWLFESVSGQESTIMGLPILALYNALIKLKLIAL